MDPVSHAAFGYAVVRAVRAPTPRLAVAASIGALAPDVDALFMPFGWDVYLRAHEIGTHSIVGSVPVALVVAIAVRGRNRGALLPLFQIAWLAVASHLLFDVVSGARLRLGWPLLAARTMVPLAAMAEPWLLAASVLGVAAIALAGRHARMAAQLTLIAIAACLAVKGVWLHQALNTMQGRSAEPILARVVEARWGSLREWNVFSRTASRFTRVNIAPDRAPKTDDEWPIASDFPLALRSVRLDSVRNLQAVHELTFAREHAMVNGSTEVLWSDVRFCWRPSAGAEPQRGPLALGTGPAQIACALWVGGTFDRAGGVLNQRVQVFGLWQTRPAPP